MFRDQLPQHLTDIAAELRSSTGAEILDELEITEAETELGRLRARTMRQVWEEAMHRGDRIKAQGAGTPIAGIVDFVGTDYATIFAADNSWDVRIGRIVITDIVRSPAGGHTVSGGSRTFKARLAEYESTGETVTLWLPGIRLETVGRISVAAADHVVLTGSDSTTVVPLDLITAVQRPL